MPLLTLSNHGDRPVTMPLVEALSQRFPDYPINIVGDRRSIEWVTHKHLVGDIYLLPKRGGWRAHLALLHRLWRRRYAVAVDLPTAHIPYFRRTSTASCARYPHHFLPATCALLQVTSQPLEFDFYTPLELPRGIND